MAWSCCSTLVSARESRASLAERLRPRPRDAPLVLDRGRRSSRSHRARPRDGGPRGGGGRALRGAVPVHRPRGPDPPSPVREAHARDGSAGARRVLASPVRGSVGAPAAHVRSHAGVRDRGCPRTAGRVSGRADRPGGDAGGGPPHVCPAAASRNGPGDSPGDVRYGAHRHDRDLVRAENRAHRPGSHRVRVCKGLRAGGPGAWRVDGKHPVARGHPEHHRDSAGRAGAAAQLRESSSRR